MNISKVIFDVVFEDFLDYSKITCDALYDIIHTKPYGVLDREGFNQTDEIVWIRTTNLCDHVELGIIKSQHS